MKVTLIFPPAADIRAPHLALACLAAYLRPLGVQVNLLDLAVEGVHGLLRPDRLRAAARRLADAPAARGGAGDEWAGLLKLSDGIEERAPRAVAILRDPRNFYDANEFNAARDIISTALRLHGRAAPVPVDFGIVPIVHDVAGCDPQRFADLVRVTADPRSDLFGTVWEEDVFPELARDAPDLVGISITNRQQIIPGLTLARALKRRGHFVVVGGTVFAKFPDELQRLPDFFRLFTDGIVAYEGETALAELLAQLAGSRQFARVPNYLYLEGDTVRQTGVHVEDLDALPTPDFTGLPLGRYLAPAPVLPIYAGKGCYYNRCRFCSIAAINRISAKPCRRRRPAQVVADVRRLAAAHGARHFIFTDESLSPRVLAELAEAFEAEPAGAYAFTGYARMEKGFTAGLCRRLARMGLKKLYFGLESASQAALDHMRKGTRVAAAPRILRNCRDHGICFHLFSIIGLPEEPESSARETFRFFLDHQDIIDHPGNSFDIHPFGLDRQAEYCARRAELGLAVDPEALAREFVIGLSARDWTNTRGLSHERVGTLINNEFYPAMRRAYRRGHNAPLHLWPAFEEYALLYSAHYAGHDFPFATTLPDAANAPAGRLRWSPAAVALPRGDRVLLFSHYGCAEVSQRIYDGVRDGRDLPALADLIRAESGAEDGSAADRREELDEMFHSLFSLGLLQSC